jgi:hypothetical protein
MTFRSVTRQIVGTNVRLRFDDSAGKIFAVEAANQDPTKEIGSNCKCGAGVEGSGNLQTTTLARKTPKSDQFSIPNSHPMGIENWELTINQVLGLLRGFSLSTNLFLDFPM